MSPTPLLQQNQTEPVLVPSSHPQPPNVPPMKQFAPCYWHPSPSQPQSTMNALQSPFLQPHPHLQMQQPNPQSLPHIQPSQPYHVILAPHTQLQPQPSLVPSLQTPQLPTQPFMPDSSVLAQVPFNSPPLHSTPLASSHPRPRKPYTTTKVREMWSPSEHARMLEALRLYKRDWAKVTRHVGTRSAAQVRSHAQKYFDRVARENTDEFVPQPRPKRKSATPYPRKPREFPPTPTLHFPHHPQQLPHQNTQNHPLPVPVSLPVSPMTPNPFPTATALSHAATPAHLVTPPIPHQPIVHQLPLSYPSNGTEHLAPVPPTQVNYINGTASAMLATPITPLPHVSPCNYSVISPMTQYAPGVLPPQQCVPQPAPGVPGHIPISMAIPMPTPLTAHHSVPTTPQQPQLYTSPIQGHEQTYGKVLSRPSIAVPPAATSQVVRSTPTSGGPQLIPATLQTDSPVNPMLVMGSTPSVAGVASRPHFNNVGLQQGTIVTHTHANGDGRDCAKCQALQRYGGVLDEIRASTTRLNVSGTKSPGKPGTGGVTTTRRKSVSKNLEKPNGQGSRRIKDNTRHDATEPLPVSDKGVAKHRKSGRHMEMKRKNNADCLTMSIEDESDSAQIRDTAGEEDTNSEKRSRNVNFQGSIQLSKSKVQARESFDTSGDEDDLDDTGSGCCRSGNGTDGANGSTDIEGIGENRKKPDRKASDASATPVDSYSQQERREIYDAVQSLQILAKRNTPTAKS